jgi:hypothetical protein
MHKSKNITGCMSIPELLREPIGTTAIYLVNEGITYRKAQIYVNSHTRTKPVGLETKKLLVVDPVEGYTQLALRVTVVEKKPPR